MWSLYENQTLLEPLTFSNGKTQEDIVNEVIKAAKEGHKIIFIKGVCGTGKSAIALNLAKHFGKTSIVVPIKSLQEQYIKDYTEKKYVLNDNNKKLKISSILGRKNFKCKFLEENSNTKLTNLIKKETNSKLSDIFQETRPQKLKKDNTADNSLLPCKIEIKEKNISMIKDYIKQNPLLKNPNFSSITQVKRMSVAPACPYYSPIISSEFEMKLFADSTKLYYKGLNHTEFTIYQRKPGCKFYEQYSAYADAEVIIFNSSKYLLETLMDRKPKTELEIIDECDEFLDSFTNQEKLSINRLLFSLSNVFPKDDESQGIINELTDSINAIKIKYESQETGEILKVKNTLIEDLINAIFRNKGFLEGLEIDDSNYLFHLEKVSRIFWEFLDETYFTIEKEDRDLTINIVTTNLEKRFKELIDKNKLIVMMSGTIHSTAVLKNIFGLDDFKMIDAEINPQGELNKCKNGYEINCKYSNFQSKKITRETFLKTFSKTIASAKTPVLVHLTSFYDLPSEIEKENYDINNLPTREEIITEQNLDPFGQRIKDFKNKKTDILFTTKCSRGIDFPGDICNSIIISRFPYPNISSLFWKILRLTNPEHFRSFYMDKANRDLLQKIYRGLRSKNDRVYLLSPDIRVLGFEL